MPYAVRSLACIVLPLVLLAGCSGDDVHGTPTPPESFGAQDTAFFGCPDMQGMYAWPPEAGEFANGIGRNEQPWAGGKPVPIGRGPMQVWLLEEGQRTTLLSRDRPADGNTNPAPRRAWGYSEHYGMACRDDMLEGEEIEIGRDPEYGCAGMRRGFRLARLEDGALAVGIRTTAHGCRGSVTVWGDTSVGDMETRDRVFWHWSKLRRIADATAPETPGN